MPVITEGFPIAFCFKSWAASGFFCEEPTWPLTFRATSFRLGLHAEHMHTLRAFYDRSENKPSDFAAYDVDDDDTEPTVKESDWNRASRYMRGGLSHPHE